MARSTSTMAELAVGTVVGEWIVERKIGAGGCGVVYAAAHTKTGKKVALKALHAFLATSPKMIQRFALEVRALEMIRHPNIVETYAVGVLDDGEPYYVMELVDGGSVREIVRLRGRLPPVEAFYLLEPIGSALSAAHEAGVVHRDLKPANVLVTALEGEIVVKLVDFGMAKLVMPDPDATGLTSAGRRIGTPSAMAPEQIRGELIDGRADIYSLGILAFFMLTGRNPFLSQDSVELEQMHLRQPPPRPSQLAPVPVSLDSVIMKCLEKSRDNRYATARAFVDAFREAAGIGARKKQTGRTVKAIAIYFGVWPAKEDAGDQEAVFDRTADVLDIGERILRESGLTIAMQTSSAVLGVETVADEAELGRRVHEAITLAARFHSEAIAGSEGVISGLSCVHVDSAIAREGSAIEGGPITQIATWVPKEKIAGVCATAAAKRAVPEVFEKISGHHVRVIE